MKTNSILTAITLVTTLATAAIAQADGSAASAASLAPVVNPMPSQIVRLAQLPSVAALTSAAASQGVAVKQIMLTSGQVVVVYRYNSGQVTAICYQLFPGAVVPSVPAATAPVVSLVKVASPATVMVVPAQPTVLYVAQASEPVYAYDSAYYPWLFSAPVGIGFGASYRGGYYHGRSYHGSYVHGGSYHSSDSRGSVRSWR